MLPPGIPYLCAYSAHRTGSRAKRSSPTGCHTTKCCATGTFCVGQSTCCQLGASACGEGLSNYYHHAFRHGRTLILKPSLPFWLCADLHLGCCPQGTTCCGKACCTPGFACVGDGDCQSTTPSTTSTTRSRTTKDTETSSTPTNPANSSPSAGVIGGAIAGAIGGLILILGGIGGIYLHIHKNRTHDNTGNPDTATQQMSRPPGSQPLTPRTDSNQPLVSPNQQNALAVPPSSAYGPVGSQTYGASGAPDLNNSAGSPSSTGGSTYGGTTAETMQPHGGHEPHSSQVQTWVEPSQRSGGN